MALCTDSKQPPQMLSYIPSIHLHTTLLSITMWSEINHNHWSQTPHQYSHLCLTRAVAYSLSRYIFLSIPQALKCPVQLPLCSFTHLFGHLCVPLCLKIRGSLTRENSLMENCHLLLYAPPPPPQLWKARHLLSPSGSNQSITSSLPGLSLTCSNL